MDVSTIISKLKKENILPAVSWQSKPLTGGTMSRVFLLHEKNNKSYILKLNNASVTKLEADFLVMYQEITLLPNVVAVDSCHRYIVYAHIPGSTVKTISSKKEILQTLAVRLINQYQAVSSNAGWGRQDAPASSWQQFLSQEVQAARELVEPFLKKEDIPITVPLPIEQNWDRVQKEPYLIHGDCGFHNFIVCEERLMGVIDPTPILGFPHYDLIYAFFSSPEDLSKDTLDSAIAELTAELPEQKLLYEEVRIGLYVRIAICIKHHPADLPAYLKAWDYWSQIADNS